MSKELAAKMDMMEEKATNRHIELIKAIGDTNLELRSVKSTVSEHSEKIKTLDERTQRHEQLVQKGQGASWMMNIVYVLVSSSVGIAIVRFVFPQVVNKVAYVPIEQVQQQMYTKQYDNK